MLASLINQSPYTIAGAVAEDRNEFVFVAKANPGFTELPVDIVLLGGSRWF